MKTKVKEKNVFALKTATVIIVGILPIFIISLFPGYFYDFMFYKRDSGVYSLRHYEISILINNYVRYSSPVFGVIAFLMTSKSSSLKNKFGSSFKLNLYFIQYFVFVVLLYSLYYFGHLELTTANLFFRGVTNNLFGLVVFFMVIVFPSLVLSLQVLLLFSKLVVRNLIKQG